MSCGESDNSNNNNNKEARPAGTGAPPQAPSHPCLLRVPRWALQCSALHADSAVRHTGAATTACPPLLPPLHPAVMFKAEQIHQPGAHVVLARHAPPPAEGPVVVELAHTVARTASAEGGWEGSSVPPSRHKSAAAAAGADEIAAAATCPWFMATRSEEPAGGGDAAAPSAPPLAAVQSKVFPAKHVKLLLQDKKTKVGVNLTVSATIIRVEGCVDACLPCSSRPPVLLEYDWPWVKGADGRMSPRVTMCAPGVQVEIDTDTQIVPYTFLTKRKDEIEMAWGLYSTKGDHLIEVAGHADIVAKMKGTHADIVAKMEKQRAKTRKGSARGFLLSSNGLKKGCGSTRKIAPVRRAPTATNRGEEPTKATRARRQTSSVRLL